ncbi:MAG TPA: DUF4124 domain-containing protein [Gammaproteobacteria bacterium]|jgi:hypothetical protein
MRYLTALFLVFLLIPSLGAADTMYKWVDAQGNVHYSDKPAPGATKIDVPKAHTFTPPPVAAPGITNTDNGNPADTGYTAITISSPQDQQTFWNVSSVTVSVRVQPVLRPGDSVTITLDGSSQTVDGTAATFTDIDRGQHTATASVGGQSSPTITFFVQKAIAKKPPTH